MYVIFWILLWKQEPCRVLFLMLLIVWVTPSRLVFCIFSRLLKDTDNTAGVYPCFFFPPCGFYFHIYWKQIAKLWWAPYLTLWPHPQGLVGRLKENLEKMTEEKNEHIAAENREKEQNKRMQRQIRDLKEEMGELSKKEAEASRKRHELVRL